MVILRKCYILAVYEFRELLLRFDGENSRNQQRWDHRSLFPSPKSDHFSSATETRMCGLADCWKPLWCEACGTALFRKSDNEDQYLRGKTHDVIAWKYGYTTPTHQTYQYFKFSPPSLNVKAGRCLIDLAGSQVASFEQLNRNTVCSVPRKFWHQKLSACETIRKNNS